MSIRLRSLGVACVLALVLALALVAASMPAARSLAQRSGANHDLVKGCPSLIITC